MSTAARPRGALGVKKKHVPRVLNRAQTMYDAISAIAALPAPPITMVAFLALITALAVAQQAVTSTKAKGSASLRNTKRDALWTAMETLRAFIQAQADILSPGEAVSLIESAGLRVAASPVARPKPVLTATLTTTAGVVHLDANASILVDRTEASKKAVFHWQWSDDGTTWHDARSTAYASTDIEGLTLIHTYAFRVSVTIGAATGPWSQSVDLLVH